MTVSLFKKNEAEQWMEKPGNLSKLIISPTNLPLVQVAPPLFLVDSH